MCTVLCFIHALCLLDKTAPNVAFEYGGDRNGDDNLKEIEVEEKQQLFDSTIAAPLSRSNYQNIIVIAPCTCASNKEISPVINLVGFLITVVHANNCQISRSISTIAVLQRFSLQNT